MADQRDDASLSPDEIRSIRERTTRTLLGTGARTAAEALAELATLSEADLEPDTYGEGGTVAVLEREVRELLGKPAAVFMPSGTMAQQIALRIHADRRGRHVVGFHPTAHPELHEDKAYQRLHGLVGRTIGDARELITLRDLEGVKEPLAAVLFELPQREIGGLLPAWDDLVAQTALVRERGVAAHLDGARLWESGPFYGRPYAEIAALFDTVYVSFYKGLGGLAGSLLLGEEDVIAEARLWRKRHGGTLYRLWPFAAAALAGFRLRVPRMAAYWDLARAIAAALAPIDGVTVVPDPPQTPLLHIHLETTPAAVVDGIRRVASERGVQTWSRSAPTDLPGIRRVELSVNDAALGFTPDEVAAIISELLPR